MRIASSGLTDPAPVRARAPRLMIKHVATCAHCADAPPPSRHGRALMAAMRPSRFWMRCARVVASITSGAVSWHTALR